MRERDAAARELLDQETFDPVSLARNLGDIRLINGILGWRAFTVRAIARYVRQRNMRQFSLLDVASGSADMPVAIAQWASRQGIEADIVATDISPQIVAVARERAKLVPYVTAEVQDALALSYPPGSFDIALCTLALHHFEPPAAVELLRNLRRVGRHVLVFDIERSLSAYYGAYALTRILRMSAMTRHDAPTSVRRAYSFEELRTLAARAGLEDACVRVRFPFRLALKASGASSSRCE